MKKRMLLAGLTLILATAAMSAQAANSPLVASYDNFNYSGTVTRYPTLADAQNQTNGGTPYPIQTATNGSTGASTLPDARDGTIGIWSDAAVYDTDWTQFGTAWYFTTNTAQTDGWGNPNNTNPGFFQYLLQSSPTVTGGWAPGYTQFHVTVDGGNGDDSNAARLWAAPQGPGPSTDTYGEFEEFHADFTANFANPATVDTTTGWYATSDMPTSFTGTISGIFHNDSTNDQGTQTNPALAGYYRFNFTVTAGSWAEANGATWGNGANGPQSFWAAPKAAQVLPTYTPVPTLDKLGLLMLVLGLLAVVEWRRRRAVVRR